MMHLRVVLASILILAINAPAYSDQAKSAYARGVHAESKTQYDAAYEAYKGSVCTEAQGCENTWLPYLRLRTLCRKLSMCERANCCAITSNLAEAPRNFSGQQKLRQPNIAAQQEMGRTAAMLKKQAQQGVAAAPKPETALSKMIEEAEGPVDLEPFSDTPLTLRMTTTADNVYKTIGQAGGNQRAV